MRNVYTCIDLGSNMIKLVMLEEIDGKFVVLGRILSKSKGIKKGIIVNPDEAYESVKAAIIKLEEETSLKVNNILCLIPDYCGNFKIEEGTCDISDNLVTKNDITKLLQNIVNGKIKDDEALINIEAISYKIDGEKVNEVLDNYGNTLSMKGVVSTVDKRLLTPFFDLFKKLDINIVDIGFSSQGDYANSDSDNDSSVAIINIGYDKTDIGVFNKGVLIKNTVMSMGSKSIDKDIAYIYNLEKGKARFLRENFAVSNTRYSDIYEVIDIVNKNGDSIKLNQLEVSEVVEARIVEILKNAKKQINILTNNEIRYIMVTGGISELTGFQYVLDNVYGRCASIIKITEIGVRNNMFSPSVGFIKYFSKKLKSRGRTYSMYSVEELLGTAKKNRKSTSDSGWGILNYFTGNRED